MKILEAYDDLDWARDKTRTPADHIGVPLTWKDDSVRLDLSGENYRKLDEYLSTLIRAAQPASPGAGHTARRAKTGRRSEAHGRRGAAYYDALTAYVDERKITKRDGTGRPAYAGAREDRKDYPDWLVKEYDEYLEKSGTVSLWPGRWSSRRK